MPSRGAEVSIAIERLRSASPGARQEVRGLAHRLRGTAGSYGFPQAGDAAAKIEDIISDDGIVLGETEWTSLDDAMLALTAAAATAADQSGALPAEVVAPGDRILVVDDDPTFLGQVGELARRHATDVLAALNAKSALEIARTQKPGAAILDVVLGPGETSFDLARELRALPGCESLPIAFISAKATPVTRIAAAHAGGSLFLEKPLDGAMFAEAAQQLLALRPLKPRVLVVNGDPEFSGWITNTLGREGMQVEMMSDPQEILASLEHLRPDVLILDILYGSLSGFDLCRMIRTTPAWRDLPILFLTGSTSADMRIAAFQAGGDDYLGQTGGHRGVAGPHPCATRPGTPDARASRH